MFLEVMICGRLDNLLSFAAS